MAFTSPIQFWRNLMAFRLFRNTAQSRAADTEKDARSDEPSQCPTLQPSYREIADAEFEDRMALLERQKRNSFFLENL